MLEHVAAVEDYIRFCHSRLKHRGSKYLTLGAGKSAFVRAGHDHDLRRHTGIE